MGHGYFRVHKNIHVHTCVHEQLTSTKIWKLDGPPHSGPKRGVTVRNSSSDLDKTYLTLILCTLMFYVPLKRPNSLEKLNMPYLSRLLTDFVHIWRADTLLATVRGLLHGLYHQRSNKGCSGL